MNDPINRVMIYACLFAFVFTAAVLGLVLAFLWLAPAEVVRCG